MKVEILDETTIYPLQKIGQRAGKCWGADITDRKKNIKRAKQCILSGHGRVLEYVDIELCISEVSARVIREWYTHIGGSPTRLQESTRYIEEGNFKAIEPSKIKANNETSFIWSTCLNNIRDTYKELENKGIPKEDCAMLLPLGMETSIVDKRNLRNIIDMAENRLCNRAYWEYRDIMKEIIKQLSELSDEWKWICENCIKCKCEKLGYCPESKGCGRYPKKDELVWGLKKEEINRFIDNLEVAFDDAYYQNYPYSMKHLIDDLKNRVSYKKDKVKEILNKNTPLNARGTNANIKFHTLDNKSMNREGFFLKGDYWSYLKHIPILSELELYITYSISEELLYISVEDDNFGQPYDYQAFILDALEEKKTPRKEHIQIKEFVEKEILHLQDVGILSGYNKNDLI